MMKILLFYMFIMFLPKWIFKKIYLMIFSNLMFISSLFMMLLMMKWNNYWSKIFMNLGIDTISISLIILTIWILSLSLLSNNYILKTKFKLNFLLLIYLLMMILFISFSSMNLMIFYIFFETSLIPIMMLIMGWGMQIDRIQASMYMIFYTLFGSLPLLIMILFIFLKMNSSMMNLLMMQSNMIMNLFMYIMLISAFLIKMPMYFTHLWLPKAHVEAPISGSMILAGIMLKLGSYGMYRLMLIFPKMFFNFNYIIIIISLMGSIYSSLICMIQTDMKIIVAYSSIVHMGVLMASMMTMSYWSFTGSLMMMIAHGLCSSGMFCLVNFNYERLKTRNLLINKGMLSIFPNLTLWWFLLCTSNFSAPPSLNLFSEMMLFNSLIMWNKFLIMLIIMISFFSTIYSIYLYSYTQYGKFFKSNNNFKNINCNEFLILFLHWIPLNMLFLNMKLMVI